MKEKKCSGLIDWGKDYKGDFFCPQDSCDSKKMHLHGWNKYKTKRYFQCPKCKKNTPQFVKIGIPNVNTGINWHSDYKMGEFICPRYKKQGDEYIEICNSRDIWLSGKESNTKKQKFVCKKCGYFILDSLDLIDHVLSRFSKIPIKPFDFKNNVWDARAINSSYHARNDAKYFNFEGITQHWLIHIVKQYIYHRCKLEKGVGTIQQELSVFRKYSSYLAEKNIHNISQIDDRSLILSFLDWNNSSATARVRILATLKNFIRTGNSQGWFKINPDIIISGDYPKHKKYNPEPLSDIVRDKIHKNIHKLPEPIQRMWIIALFSGMRPSELAFLKQDCLVQNSGDSSICWQRTKGTRVHQHSIPANRNVVKAIQLQQEYIKQLWGDDWNYLFCHYIRPPGKRQFTEIIPVKKVIKKGHKSILTRAIRYLIETEDIRDENGKLAKFTQKICRPTRATELFAKGYGLAVVQAWLGHASSNTTANHYTEVGCQQIAEEAGHIQKALFNAHGEYMQYESLPRSFWEKPQAHKLNLSATHINTPILGYCGLPLDVKCDKGRACFTCASFVADSRLLNQYANSRDELREKQALALENGHSVMEEQYRVQADQLDKIIAGMTEATA